jgi:hypothetical protein
MATAAQAQRAYDETREFYKSGWKSSNKRYNTDDATQTLANEKGLWMIQAHAKVLRRNINAGISSRLQESFITAGLTPVEFGSAQYHGGHQSGNCGAMAAVAMYRAQQAGVAEDDMWLVTVRNMTTANPNGNGSTMTFGHSWAQIGTAANQNGPYIVDPWAGVCCSRAVYPGVLTSHLNAWQRQGKRIAVQWNNSKQDWLNANDPAILSLVGPGSTGNLCQGDQRM